jgi:hypothetical protein
MTVFISTLSKGDQMTFDPLVALWNIKEASIEKGKPPTILESLDQKKETYKDVTKELTKMMELHLHFVSPHIYVYIYIYVFISI